ncbi:MAG: endonuclease III [Lachnospiraceae bacterium]|nr:endonuclease III [Lachnospiraceae bacterium]
MKKKKKENGKLTEMLELLDRHYPRTESFLVFAQPWQLLIATILSAQCTDDRVNEVTKVLYARFGTLRELAQADPAEVEEIIKPVGLFRAKTVSVIGCAKQLCERFDGKVPEKTEDLISLPGVGRKTANVVRSHVFLLPSVVVDTHVKRVSRRLGLTDTDDPVKAEFQLMEKLPEDHWSRINIQFMSLGREICKARSPKCRECFLSQYCEFAGESRKKPAGGP